MCTNISRRNFIKFTAGGIAVAGLVPSLAFASYANKPRVIAMSNLHTGENVESCYFDGRRYVKRELKKLNHLCRDFRRNEAFPMDTLLFDRISQIQKILGTNAEVQIISGYRSPITNKELRNRSTGVAKKSYHMLGQAIDFRLDGVNLRRLRDAAISLKKGGVGYYPKSQFVHIDTGPVRSW